MVQIKHDVFLGPLGQTLKAPTSGHNKDVDLSCCLSLCDCNFSQTRISLKNYRDSQFIIKLVGRLISVHGEKNRNIH